MPILKQEPDCHPNGLLDDDGVLEKSWWLAYTKSRQEKELMRRLRIEDVAHYAPQVPQRRRSPAGRIRTSYMPLFSNYVFVCGDEHARYTAICTGSVMKMSEIPDVEMLLSDLRQLRSLISLDVPMTIESKIGAGEQVRVKSGSFAGYEGTVLRRENETRLAVAVRFMDQGVSVKLEDCQLERI